MKERCNRQGRHRRRQVGVRRNQMARIPEQTRCRLVRRGRCSAAPLAVLETTTAVAQRAGRPPLAPLRLAALRSPRARISGRGARRSGRCCANLRLASARRPGPITIAAAVAAITTAAASATTRPAAIATAIVAIPMIAALIATLIATTVAAALIASIATLPVFARRKVGLVALLGAALAVQRPLAMVGSCGGICSR